MNKRPNIIVIMSDEHDPAVTGCYGDPLVRTPNLNRLAAEGIRCDACYTNSPLCVPARLSFTAGKYISRLGAWNNDCRLPSDDMPTLPHLVNSAGYQSCLCGKMHYDKNRRYGFRDVSSVGSNNSHKTGRGERRKIDQEADETDLKSWTGRTSAFYPSNESGILNHDRQVTEDAVAFLHSAEASEKPFFLLVGYLAPHFPLIAPEEIYAYYKDKVPMPNIPEGILEALPSNYKQLRKGFGMERQDEAIVKKGRELYWALTDWMDREIGKVLEALRQSPFNDDTVVIYTSDHGENKGDHGLWWKNNMFEHSARAPGIFHYPARWPGGQVRNGACSQVDMVQTIAELAGANVPGDWDGDSMLHWLDNADASWKDFALSEYYAHNIASGFTMVRQGCYKYVYHTRFDQEHGPEYELYDMENDPGEFKNLVHDPKYQGIRESLHQRMLEELGEHPDDIEQRCRQENAKGYADANPTAS